MPTSLGPPTFVPLPMGTIRPRGWLRRQLRIQASGLSGHLDEFWPDVAESGWIGGGAEGWERGPYWLDGIVPLAFALQDAALIAKARFWVDTILERQLPDGWLGPQKSPETKYQAYDVWPTFVALKALTQYQEATGDHRIIPAIQRCLRRIYVELRQTPLYVWGRSRWADLVLSVHWLYDRTGEPWLLDLAALAHEQGYDWRGHFENFKWQAKVAREECCQETHVVNNAMALKAGAVWYRQSADLADATSMRTMLDMLDAYHGQANGMWSGDEHYAGTSPSQGTELCAVVEAMFSLQVAAAITGDAWIADRLEEIAYNSLPATFSDDMALHQYDQQVNQVVCKVFDDPIWTNNSGESNTFGLEPNYGCCTANFSQGWPKFANSLWMATQDGGLAAVAYAPSQVSLSLGGAQATVTCETEYPFDGGIRITVEVDRRVDFPLYLRVPAWAVGAEIQIGNGRPEAVEGGDYELIEGPWQGATEITLSLPMQIEAKSRTNGAMAFRVGPILYALPIEAAWHQIGGQVPYEQCEVLPAAPWNYGLLADRTTGRCQMTFLPQRVPPMPFSSKRPPGLIKVAGRLIPDWGLERGVAADPPTSPATAEGDVVDLTLIPYGCAKLRLTEIPIVLQG